MYCSFGFYGGYYDSKGDKFDKLLNEGERKEV